MLYIPSHSIIVITIVVTIVNYELLSINLDREIFIQEIITCNKYFPKSDMYTLL